MQVVATHQTVDFDALAAAVAAHKLYAVEGPTVIALDRTESREVHAYLALHRDRFPLRRIDDVDEAAVTRVVVVDVRRASRLGYLGALLERMQSREVEVHVYDHHGATDDDLEAEVERVERVGSATTLLVEQLIDRGLEIDEVEATLFCLGIHTDTVSLTSGNATSRDALIVGELLDRGARLDVVNRYLHRAFSPDQRDVLRRLLERGASPERIVGLEVGVFELALDEGVSGLAEVTGALLDLEPFGAVIALYDIAGRKVLAIGRARSPRANLGRAFAAIGGGGHEGAAVANVKDCSAAETRAALVEALGEAMQPATRVGDVMSSPVKTVAPDLPLRRLARTLDCWRHTGAPVVKNGSLVGIVSHRDVAKARRADDLDVPVGGVMTHDVVTTTPDTPLSDALETMTSANVGRLPVLRRGRLLGVISRSDLLRALYPEDEADAG